MADADSHALFQYNGNVVQLRSQRLICRVLEYGNVGTVFKPQEIVELMKDQNRKPTRETNIVANNFKVQVLN